MKKVIIERASERGSIHSLSSEHYDREILFRKGCKFAFVEAAYFGGYKTFKTAAAAAKFWHDSEFSGKVIDDAGNLYRLNYYYNDVEFEMVIDEHSAYPVIEN